MHAASTNAIHSLYGEPVDPSWRSASRSTLSTKGLHSLEPLTIPFESASLPAYIVSAVGHAKNVCPLLIPTNGYDATNTDIYSLPIVAPLAGDASGGHLAPRVASGGHRLAA
jgi:hypothetical protein